ncbi:MAG: VWA domain-containing protein [Bacteroidales bacterium]|jgi:Ca-activated chloride channel family protein|nr:VWA domain-containing protein [Bacteroidales bacterium]
MFRFQNPEYLWLLFTPVVVVTLFLLAEYIRNNDLKKIGELKLVKLLIPDASLSRKIWKLVLTCLALSAMSVALARPQFGSKLEEITTQGVEIIVALDVSNSMLAQDIKPNRLSNAKKFIERIIGKLNNDKLGLIVFAGDAYIQMPITDDVRSARMFLSTINTNMVPVQGTAIGKALDLASKSFTKDEEISKIIILITDGENHEDDAIAIAKTLKQKNISVYTVGMGLPGGAPIPQHLGKGFIKDKNGNVVMSVLDEKTLIEIANVTDGIYVRAGNTSDASDLILTELDKLSKGEIVKQEYAEYDDKFRYLTFFAFLLLIADNFISERKNATLKRINLFERKNDKK